MIFKVIQYVIKKFESGFLILLYVLYWKLSSSILRITFFLFFLFHLTDEEKESSQKESSENILSQIPLESISFYFYLEIESFTLG